MQDLGLRKLCRSGEKTSSSSSTTIAGVFLGLAFSLFFFDKLILFYIKQEVRLR